MWCAAEHASFTGVIGDPRSSYSDAAHGLKARVTGRAHSTSRDPVATQCRVGDSTATPWPRAGSGSWPLPRPAPPVLSSPVGSAAASEPIRMP